MSRNGLLALGIALVLRVGWISTRPIWYDEAFSILFSRAGPLAMLQGTFGASAGAAADVHPLLYYTVLWGWMGLFGESLTVVRLLSVLSGLATVILAYFLSRALFSEQAASLSAFLVAVSPFQVHYAQEIRMYAFLALFCTGAAYALWRGLHGGRLLWWAAFSVLAALAQYAHNLAIFFLIPLAATPLLFKNWKSIRQVFVAGLVAAVLYLPWLLRLPSQFAKVQAAYWTEKPGISRLVSTLISYVTNLPLPDSWLPVALFITLFCVILGLWQSIRIRLPAKTTQISSGNPASGSPNDLEPSCGDNRTRGLWLAYLAFSPAIFLFVFSQWQPVYVERALLPSGVFFLLWLGWVFLYTRLPRVVFVTALAVLLVGMSMGIYQHLRYAGFPYAPYREMAESLRQRQSPGDVVVHSNKLSLLPVVYFDRELVQRYVGDPVGSGSDTLEPATQRVLGLLADDSIDSAVRQANRVYLIIFEQAIDEYLAAGYPAHPHLSWLDQRFGNSELERWGDLRLVVYVRSN